MLLAVVHMPRDATTDAVAAELACMHDDARLHGVLLQLPLPKHLDERLLLEQGTWLEEQAAAFKALGHTDVLVREAPVKGGAVLRGPSGWVSARDPRLAGQIEIP